MCSRPVLQPICAPLEQLTSSSFCLSAPYPLLLVPDRAVENSSTSSCQRRHTRPVDASTRSDLIREKFARGKITSTLWPLQRHFHIKEWRRGLNHLFAHSAIPAYRKFPRSYMPVEERYVSTCRQCGVLQPVWLQGQMQSPPGRSSPIHTQHNNRSRPSPGIRIPNGHRSALFLKLPLWCA